MYGSMLSSLPHFLLLAGLLSQGSISIICIYRKKICREVLCLIVLCDHPSLVSVLFAVLLSLHLVTF